MAHLKGPRRLMLIITENNVNLILIKDAKIVYIFKKKKMGYSEELTIELNGAIYNT